MCSCAWAVRACIRTDYAVQEIAHWENSSSIPARDETRWTTCWNADMENFARDETRWTTRWNADMENFEREPVGLWIPSEQSDPNNPRQTLGIIGSERPDPIPPPMTCWTVRGNQRQESDDGSYGIIGKLVSHLVFFFHSSHLFFSFLFFSFLFFSFSFSFLFFLFFLFKLQI